MDIFTEQYSRLSPADQRAFDRKWGPTPWKVPAKNQPHLRKAWKRDLDPPPSYPRWEMDTHPDSPLWMALRAKNRRAASALLDKTPSLTREEAGRCALLTLQWAPDLLERILSLGPDRPYCWLRHEITLSRERGLRLRLCGSLMMIAAALDDLPALEVLLRRGAPADCNFQRDRWNIVSDLLMGGVTMGALDSPSYSLRQIFRGSPAPDDSSHVLHSADPLSAAIFCNAKRCALRLLEEPEVAVTPAVRRALAITPGNETQTLVAARLDTPLEELLQPEDFGPELDHPLLLPVLRRNPNISRSLALRLAENYHSAPEGTGDLLLALVDPALLGDVLWEAWCHNNRRDSMLELAEQFSLPLDRCRVPEKTPIWQLEEALEHFRITGSPPEGGLSGLAASLLNLLSPPPGGAGMTVEHLLHLPSAAQVLKTEDPAMVAAYLNSVPDVPAEQTLPLLNLLNIRKEVSYVL